LKNKISKESHKTTLKHTKYRGLDHTDDPHNLICRQYQSVNACANSIREAKQLEWALHAAELNKVWFFYCRNLQYLAPMKRAMDRLLWAQVRAPEHTHMSCDAGMTRCLCCFRGPNKSAFQNTIKPRWQGKPL